MLLLSVVSFAEINDVFWGQMEQQITNRKKKEKFPILLPNEIEKSTVWLSKKYIKSSRPGDVYYSEHMPSASTPCFAAHLFLNCSCLFLIKFTEVPLLFLIARIQINSQPVATTHWSRVVSFPLGVKRKLKRGVCNPSAKVFPPFKPTEAKSSPTEQLNCNL